MKAKAKKDTYPVPPIGQWVRASYEEGSREQMTATGPLYSMQFVEWHTMMEMKAGTNESIVGIPTKMAHNEKAGAIVLFPTPEKDGELYLSFFPPMINI